MNEIEFIEYLKELNIEINEEQLKKLRYYSDFLIEYNKKVNLTSIINKKDIYLKHFFDSLTLYKAIDLKKVNTLCDVGTGAGFPGVVIKILFPNIEVTLIESINKKTVFLKELVKKLKINIEIINIRAEEYSKNNKNKYDLVTCRALSKLNTISEICIPMTKIGGYFIPMKGEINSEIENIEYLKLLNSKIEKIYEFYLPIENSKRSLIKINKYKKCDEKYPRSYKNIVDNPLK
ncbi:MAG: 16S rRNA (guanine(527)-N(7))-methyltransferase RsmG [Tenericutes bacterium]|nr:16S rRNA (guanine(527)-N(7))-methyltransferase RsmG [Bacilli bacterium]NLV89913.1 16S rRNA (guanine(527)-N(7))-methyltransferase RsmG [Mycoplasmatota bacterium]